MDLIWTICKRDLRSYFKSWTGYLIISLSLLLNGILFNAFAVGPKPKYSSDIIADFFYYSSGLGIITSILFAIKVISEEHRIGTINLYLSSPLSERQFVYGKFLAVFILLFTAQALSLYLPAFILIEGKISLGHLVIGYLGLILLNAAILSLSLFASSLTANNLLAGILASVFCFIALIFWILASYVEAPYRGILNFLALHHKHFTPFSRGVLHIKDVVYYLSFMLFFLEMSILSLEAKRL